MDLYLTRDALRTFEALRRMAPKAKTIGFLLGHTRANRFFVESVFAAPLREWPPLEEYYSLNSLWEGRIVGFFAFAPDAKVKRPLLAPFAVGKAFLEIALGRKAGTALEFQASAVDYDGRIKFIRLPLLKERGGAKRGGRP